MPLMLKRLAKWTLGGAAALVLLAVAMNAFDEDVHPEVKAYLEARPPAVPDERNGYFHMLGLAALHGEPHAAGRQHAQVLAEAQTRAAASPASGLEFPEMKNLPLPRGEGIARQCGAEAARCLANVRADKAAARKLLAEHALLLERYRALLEYPDYVETYQPRHYKAPIGPFQPLINAQQLFHVQSALRLLEGQALQVAYDLERSLAFSRRMLAGSTTLIGKMLAAAHARRAAQFVAQALPTVARADRKALARFAQALAPLSPAERSFAQAYRAELAMFGSITHICSEQEAGADAWGAVNCYFFQPNATVNRQYFTLHKLLTAMDEAPAQRLDEMRGRLEELGSFPFWSALYNPTGKVLMGVPPQFGSYAVRVHDVDALFRLVALQAQIGERALKAAEVPAFLAESAARYGDPYSGKPMGWDAERRQLYFEPRGKVDGAEKRFTAGLI